MMTSTIRWDLGISQLLPEWKALFSKEGLQADIIAGATVACVAVPLSLAIALASGVEPGVGLITAIIAGIVCAIMGGTPLAVSGPAAAMAILIAAVVQQSGIGGLLIVTFGCGVLQLLSGIFGFGQIVRFVPLPVISGFTAGIGAIIFIGQLPSVFGLPAPEQSHVVDVVVHIADLLSNTQVASLVLAILTVALMMLIPLFSSRLPAPLIAVIVPSVGIALIGIEVRSIGELPDGLPMPMFPALPTGNWNALLTSTVVVFALASLQTLLSSIAMDKLSKNKAHRHDSNQELIGQGLGNIAVCLFGGIPISGVIARSALNVQAGARTRRAAIFHSLCLMLTVYLLSSIISRIPLSVLSGVLLGVALRMMHPREFLFLLRSSKSDAAIYLITFAVIVWVDLVVGVQAGIIAALGIAALRLGRTQTHLFNDGEINGHVHVSITGSLTFLSSPHLENIRAQLEELPAGKGVVIDCSAVSAVDISGGTLLLETLESLEEKKIRYALMGVSPENRKTLLSLDTTNKLASRLALAQSDVNQILGRNINVTGISKLVIGVQKFKEDFLANQSVLFEKLAKEQKPHTLFVACSDSRINPNLITSTEPGELFIVRNVGNIIPLFGEDKTPAEGAAIEYATGILGVEDIVICGHSGCGAMNTLLNDHMFTPAQKKSLPSVFQWLQCAHGVLDRLPKNPSIDKAAQMNAVLQMENLKSFPLIRKKLQEGKLRLHAWFYDIGHSNLLRWDDTKKVFMSVGSHTVLSNSRAAQKTETSIWPRVN